MLCKQRRRSRTTYYSIHSLFRYFSMSNVLYSAPSIWNVVCKLWIFLEAFCNWFSSNPLGAYSADDSVGEVYIQIDLFTYAATGEHKVTIKGVKFCYLFTIYLFIYLLIYLFVIYLLFFMRHKHSNTIEKVYVCCRVTKVFMKYSF